MSKLAVSFPRYAGILLPLGQMFFMASAHAQQAGTQLKEYVGCQSLSGLSIIQMLDQRYSEEVVPHSRDIEAKTKAYVSACTSLEDATQQAGPRLDAFNNASTDLSAAIMNNTARRYLKLMIPQYVAPALGSQWVGAPQSCFDSFSATEKKMQDFDARMEVLVAGCKRTSGKALTE